MFALAGGYVELDALGNLPQITPEPQLMAAVNVTGVRGPNGEINWLTWDYKNRRWGDGITFNVGKGDYEVGAPPERFTQKTFASGNGRVTKGSDYAGSYMSSGFLQDARDLFQGALLIGGSQPVKWGAYGARAIGFDVDPETVENNMLGAAQELIESTGRTPWKQFQRANAGMVMGSGQFVGDTTFGVGKLMLHGVTTVPAEATVISMKLAGVDPSATAWGNYAMGVHETNGGILNALANPQATAIAAGVQAYQWGDNLIDSAVQMYTSDDAGTQFFAGVNTGHGATAIVSTIVPAANAARGLSLATKVETGIAVGTSYADDYANAMAHYTQGGGSIRTGAIHSAAVGPKLVDVAAMSAGNWKREQKDAMALAYHAAMPAAGLKQPSREDFLIDVECARLHQAVQWLGWSPGWTPPPEHAQNWLREALDSAAALKL